MNNENKMSLKMYAEIIMSPLVNDNQVKMAKRVLMTEKLKENSNYALMFVDNQFVLVDMKENKFDVLGVFENE